jgi:hypothetical protein
MKSGSLVYGDPYLLMHSAERNGEHCHLSSPSGPGIRAHTNSCWVALGTWVLFPWVLPSSSDQVAWMSKYETLKDDKGEAWQNSVPRIEGAGATHIHHTKH